MPLLVLFDLTTAEQSVLLPVHYSDRKLSVYSRKITVKFYASFVLTVDYVRPKVINDFRDV